MLLLFFVVAVAQAVCVPAQQLKLMASDQEAQSMLASLQNQPEALKECVNVMFERGYYSPLLQILNEGENTELANSLTNVIGNRLQRINGFIELLDMPTSNLQPFVKWAQNMSHVFIGFKLSHRADSPPCVNVKQEKSFASGVAKATGIEMEQRAPAESTENPSSEQQANSTQFSHSCECIVSHQRVFFKLQLTFWKSLEQLQLKKEGAGTLTLIGKKSQPEIWRHLDMSKRRLAVWDEIRQKYEADMKTFFSMIEEQEDQQVKSRKKNRRKRIALDEQPKKPTLGTATLSASAEL